MITYLFDDEITTQSVKALIEFCNNHESVIIFFSSNGGEFPAAHVMIDYLNMRSSDVIIAHDILFSSGFLVWDKLTITKQYAFSFMGAMIHTIQSYPPRRDLRGEKYNVAKLQVDDEDRINDELYKTVGKILNEDELKNFIAGQDIAITRDRIISHYD